MKKPAVKPAVEYVRHPAAVPLSMPLSPEAVAALDASIGGEGLIHPIVTVGDGKILDGWERYCSCLRVGVAPRFVAYRGEETPEALFRYVVAANLHRRHLTTLQRGLIAARYVLENRGEVRGGPQQFSVERVAALMVVGRETVQLCLAALRLGDQSVVRSIERGQITREEVRDAVWDRTHAPSPVPAPAVKTAPAEAEAEAVPRRPDLPAPAVRAADLPAPRKPSPADPQRVAEEFNALTPADQLAFVRMVLGKLEALLEAVHGGTKQRHKRAA